jgi:hypothetical protein
MNDLIAGIVEVHELGQLLTPQDELALDDFLSKLLAEIHQSESVQDADSYLDQLGSFQTELARASFKWEVQLPSKLRQLVREFDRYDDCDLRIAVFDRIKRGTFLL